MTVEIRPLDAARDADAAFELWRRSFERTWPMTRAAFGERLGDGFVAVCDDEPVGISVLTRDGHAAGIQLIVVAPEHRRRGIGTRLHDACLAALSRAGITNVRLGGTPGPYIWPGVPANGVEARQAFERWGWKFDGSCWDLTQSLIRYETPREVSERSPDGITYRWATPRDRAELVAFEAEHFPQWAAAFARDDNLSNAIVACDRRGEIVGSLIATDPSIPHLWSRLLGEGSGTINAVGVAEPARGRGVGTGLVAYASEQLRDHGVDVCHIGWTVLLGFYGRLGFRPWRRYATASRTLPR